MNKTQLTKLKKTSKIPTQQELKTTIDNEVAKKEEAANQVDIKREHFTLEILKEKWDEFTAFLKKEGREFDYNALVQDYELEGAEKIILKIPNKSQERAIDNIKQELLGFLREQLKNSYIDLVCEVIKRKEETLIYTNTEKFDYLSKKYPNLLELKRRLDLDTEF